MWTEAKPLLSLLEWSEIIGLNPWLLSQINQPANIIRPSISDGVDVEKSSATFFQNSKTSAQLGREEIAQALLRAEQIVARYLGYYPAPKELSERLPFPRPADLKIRQSWFGNSGRNVPFRTQYGRIISVGDYTESLIEADVAVGLNDLFTDGISTRFTISTTVATGTTADEIIVYYASGDRYGLAREKFRIYPLDVSISGNTATISGWTYQIVDPVNYLKQVPTGLTAADALYVEELDVYRRTVDLTNAGTLRWASTTYAVQDCDDPPCSATIYSACFGTVDAHAGYLVPIPAEYDESTEEYARLYPLESYAPDEVLVNYISGIPLDSLGRMQFPYNHIVAMLGTALLPARKFGTERATQRIHYWRALPQDDNQVLTVAPEIVQLASQLAGNAGRGAIEAASLLLDPHIRQYKTASM